MSTPPPRSSQPAPAELQPPLRRIAVADLLGGAEQVILLHQGHEYRLRVTRAGKLILTK